MAKVLETQNLYLRELTAEDIGAAYVEAVNDKEIVRFTEARHVRWDRDGIVKYVESSNVPGQAQILGIFLASNKQHIGNVRLSALSKIHHRVDLGIMIFDKSYWGMGYGTEALNRAADYAFGELDLHRICADYYAVNSSSARMFEKAGFVIEGVFKEHFLLDGKYIDSVRVAKVRGRS